MVRDARGNFYGVTGGGGQFGYGTVYQITPGGSETVLYSFCAQPECADGDEPHGRIIIDVKGNLYGATYSGHTGHPGVVYKLSRSKSLPWKETVLYNFCSKSNCTDGSQPYSGLVYPGVENGTPYDGSSPLYGNTLTGGASNNGVVYRLSFQSGKKKPTFDVIENFCSEANCADGASSYANMTADANGNLFGVTVLGGDNDNGVVYELSPDGSGGFTHSVVYAFCPSGGECTDGAHPVGIVADDASGNLYGVTGNGGTGGNAGTVFVLTPVGSAFQESVLYSFCTQANCTDGGYPSTGVVVGTNGDLFGTTSLYGTSFDGGVVFKLHGTKETVLHDFCSQAGCTDGTNPFSDLAFDAKGTIWGTTLSGGTSFKGTVFKITKP